MENLELNKELYFKILDFAKAKGYSSHTIKAYFTYLKRIIKANNVLNIDVMRKLLKNSKHRNQRAVFVLINEYCYYSKIPFNLLIPKLKSPPRSLPKILSLEEVKLMVQSAPKPYDLMLRCVYNIGAGLRISEAIKLSWNHINWIDWMKTKGYGIAVIKDAKGGKDRTTMIPEKLMKDLYKYGEECMVLNEFGVPSGGMIFECGLRNFKVDLFTNNRKRWKEEAVEHAYDWFRYNILKKHCEKALGHKINVHQLRHRRATYLYEVEKIPIEQIQKLLGHSDIRNTLIYTDVSMKKTFEKMKSTNEI